MINSVYNILYKKMSDEDRQSLYSEFDSILNKIIEENQKKFLESIQKAVSVLYASFYSEHPWKIFLREEANGGEFINNMQQELWNNMLNSSPKEMSNFELKELMRSWKSNYPEDYENAINKELLERAESAEKKLKELSLKVIGY